MQTLFIGVGVVTAALACFVVPVMVAHLGSLATAAHLKDRKVGIYDLSDAKTLIRGVGPIGYFDTRETILLLEAADGTYLFTRTPLGEVLVGDAALDSARTFFTSADLNRAKPGLGQ